MNTYKNKTEKIITYTVFTIYLLFLTWLVLFKLAVDPKMIPHMRGINLIPFYYKTESTTHLREVLFNVLVFIPAGFYFTATNKTHNLFSGLKAVMILSISYEFIQLLFAIGATDITDVITNTAGGFLGMCLYVFLGRVLASRRLTLVNTIGIILESGTLLFVSMVISTTTSLFIIFL